MAFDLTTDVGKVVLLPAGQAPDDDTVWLDAAWTRTAPDGPSGTNRASTVYRYFKISATVDGESDTAWLRLLIGPDNGDVDLPATGKSVAVFGKVLDSPETVVLPLGTIRIAF